MGLKYLVKQNNAHKESGYGQNLSTAHNINAIYSSWTPKVQMPYVSKHKQI